MLETILKDIMVQLATVWAVRNTEFHIVKNNMERVKLVSYSLVDVYNFSRYAQANIWSADNMLKADIPDELIFFEYGFDDAHVPVVAKKYYNKALANIGVFLWHETNWEYIEYNAQNQVCSAYYNISFAAGRKEKFMSLRLNGGGTYFSSEQSPEEMARNLLQDSYSFFADISKYNYETGILTTANSFSNLPGLGDYFTTDYFTYDLHGNLYKITSHNLQGHKQVTYIALSDRSARTLIQSVARQMAEYLITAIAKLGYQNKVSCIILSYQYSYSYCPNLSFVSELEMLNDMKEKQVIFPMGELWEGTSFSNAPEKLQDEFAELEQYIAQNDDQSLGEKMLIATSKILTEAKLGNVITITDDFFVFPFDWSLHGPPEKKLLKACGASAKQIKEWDNLGWLE